MVRRSWISVGLAAAAAQPATGQDPVAAPYSIRTLPQPEGIVLEVGGLDVRGDGVLGLCTRRGDVYFASGAFGANEAATGELHFTHVASGLHEPLGLLFEPGGVLCVQRGELTRIAPLEAGGTAFTSLCDAWPLSGNYHEYSYGPARDLAGRLWMTFNLSWTDRGESLVPWRGFAGYLTPEGSFVPACAGLRSPAGIAVNSDGEVFATDNQGDWIPTCKLMHLTEGKFYGHPASLRWTGLPESRVAPRPAPRDGARLDAARETFELPAVWFPYKRMGQSASGMAFDTTGGKFGPFSGQLFVGDQTTSEVLRVSLEKVEGSYQGACYPFVRGFACGITRIAFTPNGSLVVGMTSRGWPSVGSREEGLQMLTWNGTVPFEILETHARPDGFELVFTRPADPLSARDPRSYSVKSFTYLHHSRYGSDEVDRRTLEVAAAAPSADGTSVRLFVKGLREAYVHEVGAPGVRSREGIPLLHPIAFYTLNRIPRATVK